MDADATTARYNQKKRLLSLICKIGDGDLATAAGAHTAPDMRCNSWVASDRLESQPPPRPCSEVEGGSGTGKMESQEELATRLTERLPIEEAEECLCQLEEQCITVHVLGEADAQDLAHELGFTERQCDAVFLDDVTWRAKYGQGQAGALGAQANAHVAVQAMPHGEPLPDSDRDDGTGAGSAPAGALSADATAKEEHEGCGGAGLLTQVSSRATYTQILLLTAGMVLARSLVLSLPPSLPPSLARMLSLSLSLSHTHTISGGGRNDH